MAYQPMSCCDFLTRLRQPVTEKDRELGKEIVKILTEAKCTYPESFRVLNFTSECIERAMIAGDRDMIAVDRGMRR